MHREDIKAELRKRYGSLTVFEEKAGLDKGLVSAVLRGRSSSRVEAAIAAALNLPIQRLFPRRYGFNESNLQPINNPIAKRTHRLSAEAR